MISFTLNSGSARPPANDNLKYYPGCLDGLSMQEVLWIVQKERAAAEQGTTDKDRTDAIALWAAERAVRECLGLP